MTRKIYVGNLPFSATEAQLTELFGVHGAVLSVALITDRETGRPRGFGFVEMEGEGAESAIEALDGTLLGGRRLRVNEARQRSPRRKGWGAGDEGAARLAGASSGRGRGRGGWSAQGGRDGW